jgi:hypothetical protein
MQRVTLTKSFFRDRALNPGRGQASVRSIATRRRADGSELECRFEEIF